MKGKITPLPHQTESCVAQVHLKLCGQLQAAGLHFSSGGITGMNVSSTVKHTTVALGEWLCIQEPLRKFRICR